MTATHSSSISIAAMNAARKSRLLAKGAETAASSPGRNGGSLKFPLTARMRSMDLEEDIIKRIYALERWASERGYIYRSKAFYGRKRRRPGQMEIQF